MVDGRKISHTFEAASEAEAIAMAQDLAARGDVREAGAWEFECRRYVTSEVERGGLSRNYGPERLRVLLGEGERMRVSKPSDLTLGRVQSWYDERCGSGDLKVSSVNHYLLHFAGLEKFLAKEGKVLARVIPEVKTREAEDNTREVWLTSAEVAVLLSRAREKFLNRGERWKREKWPYEELWILLAAECGMRGGEIDAARASWVDLKRGVMTVPVEDAYDDERLWRRKGKRGVRRKAQIPLSRRVRAFFEEWEFGESYLLNPEKSWGKGKYRVDRGKRMRKFFDESGHEELTGHDLRRSFGSNRVGAGVSLEKVANWMGISLDTAWDRYARFVPNDGEIESGTAEPLPEASEAGEKPHPEPVAPRGAKARLEELGELQESGLISEEEFQSKRASLLAEI